MTERLLAGAAAALHDVIVAISTPPGRGAIGTVRLSGAAERVDALMEATLESGSVLEPRRATLVTLLHPADGRPIDHGVAVRFVGPRSYTGEDVLELDLHGSPAILAAAVAAFVAAGARPAGPGEFTRRAVMHGRMDLLEAEAVDAVVQADSLEAARLAGRHLRGELSERLGAIRAAMLDVASALEALVDFPEDVDEAELAADLDRIGELAASMEGLAATFDAGRRLVEGTRVVLVGPVNAGKSTLLNHLVGHDRAIVAASPGTTRDVVSETVTWAGRTFRLEDTAGLRESADPVESEGIRRTEAAAAQADVVVHVRDGRDVGERPVGLAVATHADLLSDGDAEALRAAGWRLVAAPTGEGVDGVRDAIVGDPAGPGVGLLIHTARQHDGLVRAATALREALVAGSDEPVLAALAIRSAGRALEELTGAWSDEAVLDAMFSRFCIGK